MKQWAIDRLNEASTWRGIMLIITSLTGMAISTDVQQQVTSIGLGVAGLIGVLTRDRSGA